MSASATHGSIRAPKMLGIPVPVIADPVAGPTVTYGEELTSIKFLTRDNGWARVTFDHLDSIRVSRGEFDPYPRDWKPGDQLHWVSEVVPSSWLQERLEYEKKHYGEAFKWTGDVDEMLRDFSHYGLRFHDRSRLATTNWSNLMEAHGMTCEFWPNTRPMDETLNDAHLCSQVKGKVTPGVDWNQRPCSGL